MHLESLAAIVSVVLIPLSGSWAPAGKWLTRGRGQGFALGAACASAVAGLACVVQHAIGTPLALALAAPLPQLALLGLAIQLFVRVNGREPEDVLLDASPRLSPDGLFVLAVAVGSTAPFLFLISR